MSYNPRSNNYGRYLSYRFLVDFSSSRASSDELVMPNLLSSAIIVFLANFLKKTVCILYYALSVVSIDAISCHYPLKSLQAKSVRKGRCISGHIPKSHLDLYGHYFTVFLSANIQSICCFIYTLFIELPIPLLLQAVSYYPPT